MLLGVRPGLDAVTIDAYGTLVTLADPVPLLAAALREHGAERTLEQVEQAFRAEVAYYVNRSHEGRDEATLALLRRDCAGIFLRGAEAELEPDEFVDAFIDSLRFTPVDGAAEACRTLAARGPRLALLAN